MILPFGPARNRLVRGCACLVLLVGILTTGARADETGEIKITPVPEETEPSSGGSAGEAAEAEDGLTLGAKDLWQRYVHHMDQVLEHVIELDLWGISTPQLPTGIWKIKLKANHQQVTEKFDDNGNKVPFAPSLAFPDLFPSNQNVFFVDLQGKDGGGEGFGYTLQISEGITDALNWYIEFPFQHAEINFDVKYETGNLPAWEWSVYKTLLKGIDLRTEEGFWQFVEAMGRPRLKTHFESSGWDLGDIHGGLSWNYYKSKYFAAATTGRVYFPTGYEPDANNNIELFTGAGFPAGVHAWGLSTTQGFDFRLPDPLEWVIFNAEFTYEYRFKTRRHAPIFPKRTPYFEQIFQLLADAEPDIASLFPDLSQMGDFYYITYGSSVDGEVGFSLNPFQIIPVGVKYGGGWSQQPSIESKSPQFQQYVEDVEIVGEQTKHVLAVGTALSLLPFYIPVNLAFEYQFPLGGTGSFVIQQNWAVTAELFLAF